MDEKDFSNLSDENRENLNRNGQNWNSAKSIRGEDGYNPNSLADLENSGTSGEKAQEDKILQKESSPWENNVQKGGSHKSRNLAQNNESTKSRIKGKFPKAAKYISILTAGGSIAGIGLYSSFLVGLAPIHITEMITEKLNSAASSMDLRTNKVLNLKMRHAVKGVKCTAGIICKMSTVSERNIKNLERAGFKVNTGKESLFGKKVVTSLEYTNPSTGKVTIIDNKSGSIKSILNNDSAIREAFKKGYNGRFASFLDKQWNKLKKWGKGLFKAKADNTGATEDEIIDDITSKANNNIDDIKDEGIKTGNGDDTNTIEDTDSAPKKNGDDGTKSLMEFGEEAGEKTKGSNLKTKIIKSTDILNNHLAKWTRTLNPLDQICAVYGIGTLVYTAVKDTKVQIIAQFALSFLSYSDKMKSGQATTEEVAAIGNSLMATHNSSGKSTTESTSRLNEALAYFADVSTGDEKNKAATDSQGYRAIAYNDNINSLDDSAKNYSIGAIGALAEFMANITTGVFGWVARQGCKVVGYASLAVAAVTVVSIVASCLASAGLSCVATAAWKTIEAAGFWGSVWAAAGMIISFFSEDIVKFAGQTIASFMMKDFVNSETRGEDYGNAISSGAGALMSKNARAGGAQVLTRDQAVAFYQKNQQLIAEYGKEIRNNSNPFDPTTRHTFIGSIVSSIIPHATSLRSFSSFIPSIISISSKSIASILPGANASNTAGFESNMKVCKDTSITNTGAATDIFCNVYTGIDIAYLEKESDDIIQELISSGQLEDNDSKDIIDNVKPGSDLEKYIEKCYNRQVPIGVADEDGDTGENCNSIKNPKASLFSIFLTDVRINEGMEEGLSPASEESPSNSLAGNAKNKDCKAGDLCWPIQSDNPESTITSPFGFYTGTTTPHHGIDFGAGGVTFGTPVYAIADGEVVGVGNQSAWGGPAWGYGPNILNGGGIGSCSGLGGGGGEQVVNLKHNINGKDVYSFYIHMQKNSDLKIGQRISSGTQVGEVGSYGCSTGPHLHLEVKEGSIDSPSVDPRKYL